PRRLRRRRQAPYSQIPRARADAAERDEETAARACAGDGRAHGAAGAARGTARARARSAALGSHRPPGPPGGSPWARAVDPRPPPVHAVLWWSADDLLPKQAPAADRGAPGDDQLPLAQAAVEAIRPGAPVSGRSISRVHVPRRPGALAERGDL